MIAKEFEAFLAPQLKNGITPAEQLAIFIDTHNVDHVMLLLANNGLSRVPVITRDHHYVGTVSMSDIIAYQRDQELSDSELAATDIAEMTSTAIATVNEEASLTEIMHKLVDASFLPVVQADGIFVGIITRKTILKALNSLLHDFSDHYTILKNE